MSDAPTPERLMCRPRDARGLVIPFTQFIAANGEPDFRVLDAERTARALRNRLCSICGQIMGKHIFFIGGPLCVANGLFYDPPMHHECAVYALQTCPHLARAKGRYSAPVARGDLGSGVKLLVGEMESGQKAEWFGLMHGSHYTFGRGRDGMLVISASLPWLDVERWRGGKPEPKS